ncbi:MAG: peptidoglycan D,D-transpeptidase FtsI family protein, partial [Acidobacteriota bacterium]
MVIRSLRRDPGRSQKRGRTVVFLLGAAGWGLLLIARLLHLQVAIHEELVARAERQQTAVIELPARRGDIFARGGQRLATSVDLGSIYVHPHRLPDRDAAAALLAPALGTDAGSLSRRLDTRAPFIYLRRKALPETVAAVQRVVDEAGLQEAVGVHEEEKRYYPHRSLAAHVLGFVDLDNRGQAGIELAHDDAIRGEPGTLNTLKDGWNRIIAGRGGALEDPSRGDDVLMSLDWTLQYAAEEALERAVIDHRARGGSIVALDPRSGAVLAMASYPSFNPNVRDAALMRNSRNHAIHVPFEPGSAFKVITASAALHEGVVDEEEEIDCEGGRFRVASHTYRDWKFGFEILSFREVLMNSSNVGTIKVCLRLPPDDYYRWIRDFGFGAPTGVDLPAERTGLLQAPDRWSKLTQASMAFGQEISSTPLQLATAIATIANGGLLMTPYVVAQRRDRGGETVMRAEPQVRRRVLDESIARRIGRVMEQVVEGGTGKPARIPGYRVAGKTSTAQKIDP